VISCILCGAAAVSTRIGVSVIGTTYKKPKATAIT
jgi:hypothetical protein